MGDREPLTAAERDALVHAALAAVQALDGNTLYGRGTIRPDRFPSTTYTNWNEWKRHFTVIGQANGWTDEQQRHALPTCLNGWALDEYAAMPEMYRTQQNGQPAPTLQRMITYLDPRMMPYRTRRTARAEFKGLYQEEREGIREFSRRVRSVGEIANANLNAAARDDMAREQFIDGVLDSEIHELLLREDPPNFNDAVNRALSLDAIGRSTRNGQRRRTTTSRAFPVASHRREETSAYCFAAEGDDQQQLEPVQWKTESRDGLSCLYDELRDMMEQQKEFMQSFKRMMNEFFETAADTQRQSRDVPSRVQGKEPYRRDRSAVNFRCFDCGLVGHFARDCLRKQEDLNY